MRDSNQIDKELMSKVASQDEEAFDLLVDRFSKDVKLRLLKLVRDESHAEDLHQEVFLRVWTCAEQWQGTGCLAGWLLRIATNLGLNHLRRVKRHSTTSIDQCVMQSDDDDVLIPRWMEDKEAVPADTALEQSEQREIVHHLIAQLPFHHQQVIKLVHGQDMDISEVAELLKIPAGTVKSRLHYARLRLSRTLEQME